MKEVDQECKWQIRNERGRSVVQERQIRNARVFGEECKRDRSGVLERQIKNS